MEIKYARPITQTIMVSSPAFTPFGKPSVAMAVKAGLRAIKPLPPFSTFGDQRKLRLTRQDRKEKILL
jgi:hypothetical protein